MSRQTNRKPRPRKVGAPPEYPRADVVNLSRRRFLRQTGCVAGGLSVLAGLGLPELAHGQSIGCDVSLLDAHPSVLSLKHLAQCKGGKGPGRAETGAVPQQLESPRDSLVSQADVVVENRALFVNPGYIAMIRWRRPAKDTGVVAALESAATTAEVFLAEVVTNSDRLHNVQQLNALELELAELLAPLIAPAIIDVLHLDHDCSQVCSNLGWPDPSDAEDIYTVGF